MPERFGGMGFLGMPERHGRYTKFYPIENGMERYRIFGRLTLYCATICSWLLNGLRFDDFARSSVGELHARGFAQERNRVEEGGSVDVGGGWIVKEILADCKRYGTG